MRKIIGFRVHLRPKEIARRIKKAGLDLEGLGLGEPELVKIIEESCAAAKPAVLFETFAHPDPDQTLLSPLPGLAYSLVVATIGAGFTAAAHAELTPLLEQALLEECLHFAASLIEEEAKKDSCELSPITTLTEPQALEAALRKLEGSKIGVSFSEGKLVPAASRASTLSWLARSKAKAKQFSK